MSITALEIENPSSFVIVLGVEHETNFDFDHRNISVIPADASSYEMHFGGDISVFSLPINTDNVVKMEAIGVFKIANLLKKPFNTLTDMEKTLLRSIHWFAIYQAQFENENKLLCLITCLETLFTPQGRDPIGTAIAEAVAFINSDTLAERKKIKKTVKEMYSLRSAISHGGYKAVSDTELDELLVVTRTLMLRMIARYDEFKSRGDLLNWIEEKKLS